MFRSVKFSFIVLGILLLAALVIIIPQWQNNNEAKEPDRDDKIPYLLKLSAAAGPAEQKALEAAGAEIGQSFGSDGILVRVGQENLERIESLIFVEEIKPYTPQEKLNPDLIEPGGQIKAEIAKKEVILNIMAFSEQDKTALAKQVHKLNGKVLKGLEESGPLLRVSIPGTAIAELSESPLVSYLEPYTEPTFFNDRAAGVTGAMPLWAQGFVLPGGLTGKGEIVAVADSGLDTGMYGSLHPDFQSSRGEPFKVVELTSIEKGVLPSDPIGHGTHMAGTVLGNGSASGGKFKGVAPGARLYMQSILNKEQKPDPPANLEELFGPAYAAGARIHLNSWGGKTNAYLSSSAQVDSFVRAHPDFLPVFGAGNSGKGITGKGTISTEANSKNALVVGASENPRPIYGTDSDRTDQVASFSSRGPAADGRIKPDLVAPGSAIISTASSLVKGNYKPNKNYTQLDGTSSAAAVAAGAAAQLREYLKTSGAAAAPSSALIRSALINGSRHMDNGPEAEGFGLLDIQQTVVSLKEKTMLFDDCQQGVGAGEVKEYTYTVTNPETPLKVTLAWTDPAAAPSSGTTLINNLDLMIVGPGGKRYYGNDFANRGQPDTMNNVEQVLLENPQRGSYTIKVMGTSLSRDASALSSGVKQDFALVYGQPLPRAVLASSGAENFFADNGVRNLDRLTWKLAIDGKRAEKMEMTLGADVLLSAFSGKGTAYMSYQTVAASNMQGKKVNEIQYLSSVNEAYCEGGFRLASDKNVEITVNDKPALSINEIPPGSDVLGVVNPSTGELWRVETVNNIISGDLESIDRDKNVLRLKGVPGEFQIGTRTSIKTDIHWHEYSPYDSPFGGISVPGLDSVLAGSPVVIVVSPWTREIGSLTVHLNMLSGVVEKVDAKNNEVRLVSGNAYKIPPEVERDGKTARIEDIQPGDRLEALLFEHESKGQLTRVKIHSRVVYGRIIGVDSAAGMLVIKNEQNKFQEIRLSENARITRQHLSAGLSNLRSGDWVRLVLTSFLGRADRVDAVYGREIETEVQDVTVKSPTTWKLQTTNGDYIINEKTRVLKNDLPVKPLDLVSGEKITITSGRSLIDGSDVPGIVSAEVKGGTTAPGLSLDIPSEVSDPWVTLTGHTSGKKIYLYKNDSFYLEVKVEPDGSFKQSIFLEQPGRYEIKAVVVDPQTGGVNDREGTITRISNIASDIRNHWAERDIHALISRGIVKTETDGRFYPDRPISRGEFVVSLVKTVDQPFEGHQDDQAYLKYAADKGLILGDGKGNLFADRGINRAEAAAFMMRALRMSGLELKNGKVPLYRDWEQIPEWAREDVTAAFETGIFVGRTDNSFGPGHPLTRAEAVSAIVRTEKFMQKNNALPA